MKISPFLFFYPDLLWRREGNGLSCPVHTKFLRPLLPQSNPDVGWFTQDGSRQQEGSDREWSAKAPFSMTVVLLSQRNSK
jgi:hypothetical protein